MQNTINTAIELLKQGKVILYPSDTIWGIGCDATNVDALKKIYEIKEREATKSVILLVSSEAMLNRYVDTVPEMAWNIIDCADQPTTIIYSNPKNLPKELLAKDGSIGIRLVKTGFCNQLIHKFNKPLVSTSANISGQKAAITLKEVDPAILSKVDYVVDLPNHKGTNKASSIIKVGLGGEIQIIRK